MSMCWLTAKDMQAIREQSSFNVQVSFKPVLPPEYQGTIDLVRSPLPERIQRLIEETFG